MQCQLVIYVWHAQVALVGAEDIQGAMRSPFYSDPSPCISSGSHASFNETFGTDFTSWKLAYWDLEDCPGPITDANFCPTPQAGYRGREHPRYAFKQQQLQRPSQGRLQGSNYNHLGIPTPYILCLTCCTPPHCTAQAHHPRSRCCPPGPAHD